MNSMFEPVSWSLNTSLYEVNLRQYTKEGTFNAFSKEMPRLKDMGVDVLWFMPVTPISQEKRQGNLGSYYACSDYTATNPEFGTINEFRKLVNTAHQLGFKVVIDWVANHTGWDHVWTKSHPEYYKKNAQGDFYDNNGWQDVIDLNYYDHSMRRAMIDAMEFWIKECDIDGFRCDMAHLVPLDFWRDARLHLDKVKPLFWLAESEHNNYQHAFDCSYAWNWMHITESFAKKKAGVEDIRQNLLEYHRKRLLNTTHLFFTSNHDENSWNGTEYEKYGNAALPLAVLAATWDGLFLIYSGQEIPNQKRLKFFDKDPIEWTAEPELHNFYNILLALRRSFNDEKSQTTSINTRGERQVLAFLRTSTSKNVLTLINLSEAIQNIHIDDASISGSYKDIFTGMKHEAPSLKELTMGPWSYFVLDKLP